MSENSEKLFAEFPEISTEAWEATIEKDLKGADYNKKLVWKTDERFDVKPYYREEDLQHLNHLSSQPGQFPYVRGNRNDANPWSIVETLPAASPEEANSMARESLSKGADAVIFNVEGMKQPEDADKLLAGLDLAGKAVYFDAENGLTAFAEALCQWMEKHPQQVKPLHGALLCDPIMDMLQQGKFRKDAASDLQAMAGIMQRMLKLAPDFRPLGIRGHVFGNCGATLTQELAYTLNIANEYLAFASEHGIAADTMARCLQFTFSIGSDYFMEIAKPRAARLLWSVIVAQYLPDAAENARMNLLSMASSWNKTLFDAHINILRNTTEGMSAAIGGANAIALHPFDEAYKVSDNFSRHIARNSQIILKEESHFDKVVDPAAGSYYIENLTHSIIGQAWELFKATEKAGGIIAEGLKGNIKAAVEESCSKRNTCIATRRRTILGSNQYPNLTETMADKVEALPRSAFAGLQPYRGAIPFEELRLTTEQWASTHGGKPKVFLLKIGNLAMRQARAGFVTNFFGCAGYQIVETAGYATAAEGIQDAVQSGAAIVAICSSDEEYPVYAPEIIEGIHKACPQTHCIIAGNPTESMEALKAAGAEDFIHVRTNILESLTHYNQLILK